MMKKIILTCLCCHTLATKAVLDMTMDRPLTTDIPPTISDLYFKPGNKTRPCIDCPHRKNRWARCNGRNLQIKNNKNDII